MAGGIDITTGITIVLGTTGWTARVIDGSIGGVSVEPIDKTHHGSAQPNVAAGEFGGREFVPGALQDGGTLSLTCLLDPSDPPPVGADVEVMTLTYKKLAADATAAKLVGDGFIQSMSQPMPIDDMYKVDIEIKLSGVWVPTAAT